MALKKFAAVELVFLRHNTIIMNSDTLRSAEPLECIKDAPDITEDTAIAAEIQVCKAFGFKLSEGGKTRKNYHGGY